MKEKEELSKAEDRYVCPSSLKKEWMQPGEFSRQYGCTVQPLMVKQVLSEITSGTVSIIILKADR